MLINQEFINHPTPAEVSFIRIGIEKLYKKNLNLQTRGNEWFNSLYNGSVRERDTRRFLGVD